MRAWHKYRVKTGRPRTAKTYWRVKGFSPHEHVRVVIIEAPDRTTAINQAMAAWGFPILMRVGASVTHGCAA